MICRLRYAAVLCVLVRLTLATVVTVTVTSARILSVSALVIAVIAVTITMVMTVMMTGNAITLMTVMAFMPGVFLLRCCGHLCVCFWNTLL